MKEIYRRKTSLMFNSRNFSYEMTLKRYNQTGNKLEKLNSSKSEQCYINDI